MTDRIPIARLTDPRIMAAQIRAWANVVDALRRELDALPNSRYAGERARDLAAQMRSVAAREGNAYPDREVKRSWEHQGEEPQ